MKAQLVKPVKHDLSSRSSLTNLKKRYKMLSDKRLPRILPDNCIFYIFLLWKHIQHSITEFYFDMHFDIAFVQEQLLFSDIWDESY